MRPRNNRERRKAAVHIFLTGDIHIGKSTVLQRVIEEIYYKTGSAPMLGGFRTVTQQLQGHANSEIFLLQADGKELPKLENRIAIKSLDGSVPVAFPEVFDRHGCDLLNNFEQAQVILMDELGFLENEASAFQQAVFDCLAGEIQVLGVVRAKSTPFLDMVRQHCNVQVFTVTADNRDALPAKITQQFGNLFAHTALGTTTDIY